MEDSEKLYYSISEVAEMLEVNSSLIRFWEKEFEQIKPNKNKKGDRFFTKKDIEVIKNIFHLLKVKGFTIEGAKRKLNNPSNDTQVNTAVIKRLNKIKQELLKIDKNLI